MNALDGLWEAVLDDGESTEGEDEVSLETNSTSHVSSVSAQKQVRWLLPNRQSHSIEEEVGDWWGLSPPTQDSPKQKWSFRKRDSKKGSGIMKRKKKEDPANQDASFWSLFDAGTENEVKKGKARSTPVDRTDDDDNFWGVPFGFFDDEDGGDEEYDDRNDRPVQSALKRRGKYSSTSMQREGRGKYSSKLQPRDDGVAHSRYSSSRIDPLDAQREEEEANELRRMESTESDIESLDKEKNEQIDPTALSTAPDEESDDDGIEYMSEKSSRKPKIFRWRQGRRSSGDNTVQSGSVYTADGSRQKKLGVLDLVICRSRKQSDFDEHFETRDDIPLSEDSTARVPVEAAHTDRYATVRFFSDGKEVSDGEVHKLSPPENNELAPDTPISVQMYEDDDDGPSIGVAYDYFGSDLQLRTYSSPPTPGNGEVLIKVEASTVSHSDCIIYRGAWWKQEDVPLPNTPGVDVVGVVQEVSRRGTSKWHVKPGDRVTAFCKWGGNARYAVIKADSVVHVREKEDPATVACLPDTYLSAFQALHIAHGSSVRYGSDSLEGKSILVIGALSSVGKAVVELAFAAGSTRVYATAKSKHHDGLKATGVRPLDRDAETWIHKYYGRMDLVLVADCDQCNPYIFKSLSLDGHFVFIGRRVSLAQSTWLKEDKATVLSCVREKGSLMKRTHAYDVFESWDRNATRCKHDLRHLLLLLSVKTINPHIVDRMPLEKIARAHKLLNESKRVPGVLVCEPWVKSKRKALYM